MCRKSHHHAQTNLAPQTSILSVPHQNELKQNLKADFTLRQGTYSHINELKK